VPDDVTVIGPEDSPPARHTDPALATVRQPPGAMGRTAAIELPAPIGRLARTRRMWCSIPNL
jgi:DNA-binding LacI/PurR family transcriptional regulator